MNNQGIFQLLERFRNIPTFQLERRLDMFLYPYLQTAINQFLKIDDVRFVYPEFPLRPFEEGKGIQNKSEYSSAYADYVLWSPGESTVYLVELKTDTNSVDENQFTRYIHNCEGGWEKLFRYYFEKTIHSAEKNYPKWRKFTYGLDYLYNTAQELTGSDSPFSLSNYYNKNRGQGVTEYLKKVYDNLHFEKDMHVKLIYISPAITERQLEILVNDVHPESRKYYAGMLAIGSFAQYADPALKKFLLSLENPSFPCKTSLLSNENFG